MERHQSESNGGQRKLKLNIFRRGQEGLLLLRMVPERVRGSTGLLSEYMMLSYEILQVRKGERVSISCAAPKLRC